MTDIQEHPATGLRENLLAVTPVREPQDLQERQLSLDLGSVTEQAHPGYRLKRVEVYNWGTFDRQVWRLNLDGKNGLLTGDIGSGKSTLVDAITTLLVQRAAYNKAAGAESKERTLKSYVLGYYKNERNEMGSSAKPVALRDNNQFSAILAVFHNAGYQTTTSIAQIFWVRDPSAPPERRYICAERELSIASDLSDFRGDVSALRRKLAGSAEIFDSFKEYGAWFRRRLGIESEQALELFHQTVSMKSVSNLTDFVRAHMLESFDVESRIKDLIRHFDDLTSAHDAVLKAKRQVQLLQPLVENCRRSAALTAMRDELKICREALKLYFSRLKVALLEERIQSLSDEWTRQDAATKRLHERVNQLRAEESKLRLDIAANGGDRIEKLREEISQCDRECQRRKDTAKRYEDLLTAIGESLPEHSDQFIEQRHSIKKKRESASDREPEVQNELTELEVAMRQKKREYDAHMAEIADLSSRRSNIPSDQMRIRTMLCEALKINPTEMPFAGELLQVRDDERDWEGAAERLLRGFGLSILVPDRHYDNVADWVDRNHLKGRLVYFRVRPKTHAEPQELHEKSLAKKISIKPDSIFYDWLEREVFHRADFVCCESQDEFKRAVKAVTRAGQIKRPGEQHEKDDRSRIDDRSRYILGWTNEAKINALKKQAVQMQAEGNALASRISALLAEKKHLNDFIRVCERLEEYPDFEALDWQSKVAQIAKLQKEKEQIESTSDLLRQLNEQLKNVSAELSSTETAAQEQLSRRSRTEQKRADLETTANELQQFIAEAEGQHGATKFEALDAIRAEALGEYKLTVENCDNAERTTRERLQDRIDAEQKKIDRINSNVIQAMTEYNKDYPLETQEVDANIDSASDYERMLATLEADDLPRFESRFKQLLNENTINEVANFRSQLDRQRELIKERIEHINESLTKVPYNEGRYIRLEAQLNNDADIRDFQTQLRSCTENALTGSDDEQYSEAKFLQVKAVIERFRGREGQSDLDKKWTSRVSDVRNWFSFAASERWLEDDTEFEHYSDSGGKSGGQKEKLAYTILAASLAYQFGLEWGATRSRSFRFVVIDEAFGRGSDESAQYGLKLFEQLNLQLLVVTPLQKIHIIEPFVAAVGFVQNEHGNASKLRNLTIAEYREKKAEILGL
ncbi:MAG TPA: SbcC/MukB-like Walker B domain-containing protein [Candidatus Obscuribacterales bacterium]